MILVIEKCLWNSNFGTFSETGIMSIHIIQYFLWSMISFTSKLETLNHLNDTILQRKVKFAQTYQKQEQLQQQSKVVVMSSTFWRWSLNDFLSGHFPLYREVGNDLLIIHQWIDRIILFLIMKMNKHNFNKLQFSMILAIQIMLTRILAQTKIENTHHLKWRTSFLYMSILLYAILPERNRYEKCCNPKAFLLSSQKSKWQNLWIAELCCDGLKCDKKGWHRIGGLCKQKNFHKRWYLTEAIFSIMTEIETSKCEKKLTFDMENFLPFR